MIRRFCDRCGADITFYKDYIVKMKIETESNKIEFMEQEDQSFDLCDKCWRELERCIYGRHDDEGQGK